MALVAHDEAGNEGKSEPREFTLPQRIFVKPVARALIEQRRILALDANAKPLVLTALEALTIAPEKFTPEAAIYLGLRSIYFDLDNAKSDDELRAVVARLWEMAMQIEDGNMSRGRAGACAPRRTRCARRSSAARARRRDQEADGRPARRARQIHAGAGRADAEESRSSWRGRSTATRARSRQQDLKSMLDRLEQLARSGNKDAAQRLLEQLQSMLENLQMAQPGAGDDGDDDMNVGARRIGRHDPQAAAVARQDLQEGPGPAPRPPRGNDKSKKELGDLRQDQKAPARPAQAAARAVAPARADVRRAEERPRPRTTRATRWISSATPARPWARPKANSARATPTARSRTRAARSTPCARARRAWRRRCRTTAFGPGPNGRPDRPAARAQNDTDPLGRPLRGRDYDDDNTVKVPGEIDAQRARRILEELRKRFGESFRPQLELDYIERLLKDF